jgi:hypothetical protein
MQASENLYRRRLSTGDKMRVGRPWITCVASSGPSLAISTNARARSPAPTTPGEVVGGQHQRQERYSARMPAVLRPWVIKRPLRWSRRYIHSQLRTTLSRLRKPIRK